MPKIPRVRDCIRYIQTCGYMYNGYNRPWYGFSQYGNGREVWFTLSEIRHAYTYGW